MVHSAHNMAAREIQDVRNTPEQTRKKTCKQLIPMAILRKERGTWPLTSVNPEAILRL
jgi:hypothetical protein